MEAELSVQDQQAGKEAGLHPIPTGKTPAKKAVTCSGTKNSIEEE